MSSFDFDKFAKHEFGEGAFLLSVLDAMNCIDIDLLSQFIYLMRSHTCCTCNYTCSKEIPLTRKSKLKNVIAFHV